MLLFLFRSPELWKLKEPLESSGQDVLPLSEHPLGLTFDDLGWNPNDLGSSVE